MGKSESPDRTVLQLSMTTKDKRILAQAALDRGVTMAALVHEWIENELSVKEKVNARDAD